MTRKNQEGRTTYNLFIGKSKDGEYIFLEDAFRYSDGFKGLTGNTFEFLTQGDLNDRVDELKACGAAESIVIDNSYCNEERLLYAMEFAKLQESKKYKYSDCHRGGRIFKKEMLSEDYYEYVIPENLKVLHDLFYEYEE